MPRLVLLRSSSPGALEATLYEPVLCVVLRGRKEVTVADRTLSFGPGECLLVTYDLPVLSRVTEAPYVALALSLNLDTVRTLEDEVDVSAVAKERASSAQTQQADESLLEALHRYIGLAASPREAKVLGPLILKEIHYRLLVAPFGGMLRKLLRQNSHASAIARATGHLRRNLRAPIVIPELARQVGMSPSSFHKYFTSFTETTPLQYQKQLRLLEARQLLKAGNTTVTSVALDVGYESLSQFSREYARKFGAPPSQEINRAM